MAPAGVDLAIVVARASNGVIGVDGKLPWRQKSDMARFRAMTTGKPVIMGRKTWESLKGPLKDRDNIVLTRSPDLMVRGGWAFAGWDTAVACAHARAAARGAREICIIGGADIYAAALPLTQRLYLTEVVATPEGDTLFPALNPDDWRETDLREAPAGPDDQFPMRFRTLERIA